MTEWDLKVYDAELGEVISDSDIIEGTSKSHISKSIPRSSAATENNMSYRYWNAETESWWQR